MSKDKTEAFDLTVEIWAEELSDKSKIYVSRVRELDIASQGETFELAQNNLEEAVLAYFENASESELDHRLQPFKRRPQRFITQAKVDLKNGHAQGFVWA